MRQYRNPDNDGARTTIPADKVREGLAHPARHRWQSDQRAESSRENLERILPGRDRVTTNQR